MAKNDDKLPFKTNATPGGGAGPSPSVFDPAPAQKEGTSHNPSTEVGGGRFPKADPSGPGAADTGAGTLGGKKPFKLNG